MGSRLLGENGTHVFGCVTVWGVELTNGSVEITLASEALGSVPGILIVAIGCRPRRRRWTTVDERKLLNVEYELSDVVTLPAHVSI